MSNACPTPLCFAAADLLDCAFHVDATFHALLPKVHIVALTSVLDYKGTECEQLQPSAHFTI